MRPIKRGGRVVLAKTWTPVIQQQITKRTLQVFDDILKIYNMWFETVSYQVK